MPENLQVLASWGGWAWLILAAVLTFLETMAPGLYMFWFALAAAATGALTLNTDISWVWQIAAFSAFSVLSLLIARLFFSSGNSDLPNLNMRAQQQIGQSYILDHPVAAGRGKLQIGDTLWTITGPDVPVGTTITITGTDGTVLYYEPERRPNLPKAGAFSA